MNDLDIGNTKLVDHGITTERSDLRAHVCVNAGMVYVFKTSKAVEVIENGNYKRVDVYTQGIITAQGHAVPVMDIDPIEIYASRLIGKAKFEVDAKTSDKGDRAVWVIEKLLEKGKIPIPFDSKFVTDSQIQKQGFDLVVHANFRIEVKCDYRGGLPRVHNMTTGNLFLQIAECNPFRQY